MDKNQRPNRVREALGQLYDQQPPYFREYLRRFQEDPRSRVFAPLAEAHRRMGRIDEAIQLCLEGLSHHPDFPGGRVALARCYMDRRDHKKAKEELERVIRTVPENLLAQRLLGDICMALGENAQALHAYKMALLLAPNDVSLSEKVHQLEQGHSAVQGEAAKPFLVTDVDLAPLWETQAMPEQAAPLVESAAAANEELLVEFDDGLPSEDDVAGTNSLLTPEMNAVLASSQDALGTEADLDDDAFRVEHVSKVFDETEIGNHRELTSETLGDLYLTQGQPERALRIFEKIAEHHPTAELERKMASCRQKLGVDRDTMIRKRKLAVLRGLMNAVKQREVLP